MSDIFDPLTEILEVGWKRRASVQMFPEEAKLSEAQMPAAGGGAGTQCWVQPTGVMGEHGQLAGPILHQGTCILVSS